MLTGCMHATKGVQLDTDWVEQVSCRTSTAADENVILSNDFSTGVTPAPAPSQCRSCAGALLQQQGTLTCASSSLMCPLPYSSCRQLCASGMRPALNAARPSCAMVRLYRMCVLMSIRVMLSCRRRSKRQGMILLMGLHRFGLEQANDEQPCSGCTEGLRYCEPDQTRQHSPTAANCTASGCLGEHCLSQRLKNSAPPGRNPRPSRNPDPAELAPVPAGGSSA